MSLGTHTSIATGGITIGKNLKTEVPDVVIIDVSNIECSADASFIHFINDVSFQKSIHGNDVSFHTLGSSSNDKLVVVSDASFHKHFQGIDVSFNTIGSPNDAFLEITDDVSFQKSIHGNDVSFHTLGSSSNDKLVVISDASFHGSMNCVDISLDTIGAIDGQNLIIANDVSFHNHIVGNDASINVISNANASNTHIVFRDASFNNSIFGGDVSFNNISSVNTADKLHVTNMTIRHTLKKFLLVGGPDDLIGGQTNTYAGTSTALSADGKVVAVGAGGYSYGNDNDEGRVQVFDYTGGSWVQRGSDLSGGQASAYAGSSTALSEDGNVVAVGATGYNNAGRVQVFDYTGGSWVQRGSDLSGGQAGAQAGWSTALNADGNVVAVGASGYNYGNDSNAGRVQVFDYSGNSWVQRGLDLSGGQAGARTGYSTALSADGNVVAVGADEYNYTDNNNAGRVQVFEYSGNSWILKGGPDDLSGGQAGAQAGWSTALSADGNVVAVGADEYNYTDNNNAGRVKVFDYSGNSWVQRGSDLSGGQAGAQAGYSTALSADGNVVAVGARGYDNGAGRVQVHTISRISLSMSQLLSKWYDNAEIPFLLVGNVSY